MEENTMEDYVALVAVIISIFSIVINFVTGYILFTRSNSLEENCDAVHEYGVENGYDFKVCINKVADVN